MCLMSMLIYGGVGHCLVSSVRMVHWVGHRGTQGTSGREGFLSKVNLTDGLETNP